MKNFRFVLTDRINVDERRQQSKDGLVPRTLMIELAERLGGVLYEPNRQATTGTRRQLVHHCLNTPLPLVELAKTVAQACADDDIVFCIGEAVALPLAYELKRLGKPTKLASFGHNIYRPRTHASDLIWGCLRRVDLFLVFTAEAEAKSAKNRLYIEQTDEVFFSKAPKTHNAQPILVSIGLEKRDNQTLADATHDLDADVRITAFSRDARKNPRALPDPMPANMSAQFYAWTDLADLYRKADLVVVPLLPTNYAAGITSVLEGAAAGCAVVASDNPALKGAVADHDIAAWVPAEDSAALRQAIVALLEDHDARDKAAARAHRIMTEHHSFSTRLEAVENELRKL